MCERISLDGPWEFYFDFHKAIAIPDQLEVTNWRTTFVPEPWQARFSDLRDKSGVGWYRRAVTVPSTWLSDNRATIIHFGAVDYFAEVWFNNVNLGSHEGGYLPFQFDVQPHLCEQNEILVRVVDPSDNPRQYPDYPFSEIPHGKQSWYGQTSGLWQSVWMECRPARHIHNLRLTPDLHTGEIEITAPLSQSTGENAALWVNVTGPQGENAL